jgi:hypothetical protein
MAARVFCRPGFAGFGGLSQITPAICACLSKEQATGGPPAPPAPGMQKYNFLILFVCFL